MVFNNINFIDEFGKQQKLEFNNIYCVDCMKILKLMPDKSIDLCIVDPPYGINVNISMGRRKGDKKSNYTKYSGEDKQPPSEEYFKELFRVSKNQIIWGANHFISKFSKDSANWIVWNKLFSNDVSFASAELAWCSLEGTIKIYTQSPLDKDRIHPTQKPIALYEWLLNNYAKKGDKILDTHLGSASSIIACKKLGFEYMGFELDEEYFNKAKERIEKFESQENLFDFINTSETISIKQTTLF